MTRPLVRRDSFVAIAAALLLVGCGFHLRSWDLGGTFDAIHIDADASVDLDRELGASVPRRGRPLG